MPLVPYLSFKIAEILLGISPIVSAEVGILRVKHLKRDAGKAVRIKAEEVGDVRGTIERPLAPTFWPFPAPAYF